LERENDQGGASRSGENNTRTGQAQDPRVPGFQSRNRSGIPGPKAGSGYERGEFIDTALDAGRGGYIKSQKGFKGRKPYTGIRLSAQGEGALNRYLDEMESMLNAVREKNPGQAKE